MATTGPTTDDSASSTDSTTDNEHVLTLTAEGEATRYRGKYDESTQFTVTDTVHVEITIDKTIDELADKAIEHGRGEHRSLAYPIHKTQRSLFRSMVNDELAANGIEVDRDTFEQWDVSFDGDVRAWLTLLERCTEPLHQGKLLEDADCFGDGLDAAMSELRRRNE